MNKKKTINTNSAKEIAESLNLNSLDAIEWEIRDALTDKIIEFVGASGITVTQLAKDSRTSRARITKILKGDPVGISLDVLFRVLGATGHRVQLKFLKAA